MSRHRWAPVLLPLADWLEPQPAPGEADSRYRLELADTRLTEARALLSCAEELIRDTVARHRPQASGPAAAVELDVIAARLAALGGEGLDDNPVLLRRAAVLCAGEDWSRLAAVAPVLRLRISTVSEAIAETAVLVGRLGRGGPPGLQVAPSPEVVTFAQEEAAVAEELRRHTAKAGAQSAWTAADRAFLPSLHDFLG